MTHDPDVQRAIDDAARELVRRESGELVVRPFRGLRRPT